MRRHSIWKDIGALATGIGAALALDWARRNAVPAASAEDQRLRIYLNDHLAGSTVAIGICRRSLSNNAGTSLERFLTSLLREIEEDRQSLLEVMRALGLPRSPIKPIFAWTVEKVARVKLNEGLVGYSDLSRVLELEQLAVGIRGKLALWVVLEQLALSDVRLTRFEFAQLRVKAERQRRELEPFRIESALRAFSRRQQRIASAVQA